MGTPVIAGDLTGSVIEDSGVNATGDLDDINLLTGNDDDTWSIAAGPTYGTASIDPVTGQWTYVLDDSNPVVNALDPGETLEDTFTVLVVDVDGGTDTEVVTITINGVICFLSGTQIETMGETVSIETLKPGDRVHTENGYRPILWVGQQTLDHQDLSQNEKLRPIRIKAGALGPGVPIADLVVSRQHRILVDSVFAQSMFGTSRVFVAAAKLTALPGIDIDHSLETVTYHHLLFDKHEVIFAEGTPSESLFTGPEVFKTVNAEARKEILALLPHLAMLDYGSAPAHPIPSGKQQKELVEHHRLTSEPITSSVVAARLPEKLC